MILHINTEKTWRGGEQQLLYLLKGLQQANQQQIIIGQPNSELEKRAAGIAPYFPIKMMGELDPFCIRKVSQIIRTEKVKIIHAHTAKAHSIALRAKYKNPYTKLIVSRRVDFPIKKNFLSKRKYFSDKIDAFLCVSDNVRSILIKDGVNSQKTITVRSGVDTKRFVNIKEKTAFRQEFQLSDETIMIGNVAALVDHKDQKTLLNAIAKIQTEKKFVFLIIGDGKLKSELQQLASDLNINDKVLFLGFRKDIPELLKFIDIFTLTSKEEGLGTSVLDAMASGLPTVVTNGGGIGEMIVHEKGGLISNVGDSDSLAKDFTTLIESEELRKQYGAFNLQHVQNFSVEETVKQTIAVYESLLS
ncbi:MAG: glycosyltransferase family 4 protein [Spirochaetota bacterium]